MRCKACDKIMEDTEIIWDEERKEHEELCSKCLKIINDLDKEEFVDEEDDIDSLVYIDIEEISND